MLLSKDTRVFMLSVNIGKIEGMLSFLFYSCYISEIKSYILMWSSKLFIEKLS